MFASVIFDMVAVLGRYLTSLPKVLEMMTIMNAHLTTAAAHASIFSRLSIRSQFIHYIDGPFLKV